MKHSLVERNNSLSSVDRSALVLLGMGEDAAAKVLQYFTREETQQVTRAMAQLTGIKSAKAKAIIQSFFDQFGQHSGIRGASKEYLSNTLRKALGNDLAQGLLNSIYGDEIRVNMQRLQWVEPEILARFIQYEHPQMQAIFLAYLSPETSSAVLGHLPDEVHDLLLFRIAKLQDIDHAILMDLQDLIEKCISQLSSVQSTSVTGIKQVADMINRYQGDKGQLLELLRLHDESMVEQIEINMFDFNILSRQSDETMDLLGQQIPTALWSIALKGADDEIIKAVKRGMPQRMIKVLDDEMNALGALTKTRVDTARNEIMEIIREFNETGDIALMLYEEATVE